MAVSTYDFRPGYRAPFARGAGDLASSLYAPDRSSLFALKARAGSGASVEWDHGHGDEALYLIDGQVRVGDVVLGSGGVVIVEAGVPALVEVISATELLHLGPRSGTAVTGGPFGAPEPGCRVHVVPAADAEHRPNEGFPHDITFFADSGCPTCRISVFTVSNDGPWKAGAHQHSEDEILTVLHGDFMVGPTRVPPGSSIAVPADTYYGYQALGPYRFVNYRANASYATFHGKEPVLDSGPLRT